MSHLFDVPVGTMTFLLVNPNSIDTMCNGHAIPGGSIACLQSQLCHSGCRWTIRVMYPPIRHCLHVLHFATPSVIIYFICAPCGAALWMLGLGCAKNPCRELFLRPRFVSAERLKHYRFVH